MTGRRNNQMEHIKSHAFLIKFERFANIALYPDLRKRIWYSTLSPIEAALFPTIVHRVRNSIWASGPT